MFKTKIEGLTSVVASLKEDHLICSGCPNILETTFTGEPHDLTKTIVTQNANKDPGV